MTDELEPYVHEGTVLHTPFLTRSGPAGDGVQKLYRFPNTYGASVVRHQYSYGGDAGLWELAVALFHGEGADDFKICYTTPVTDDVLGWLSDGEVELVLDHIAALPRLSSPLPRKEVP